jgi:hypothetical protein
VPGGQIRADILELDGERVVVVGGGVVCAAAAAAFVMAAAAVQLAEVAEVAAGDAREDVVGGVPHGGVVAARLQGPVVQGALAIHDQLAVLLRAQVSHRAEQLIEHTVRVGHRHQPVGGGRKADECRINKCSFSFSGAFKMIIKKETDADYHHAKNKKRKFGLSPTAVSDKMFRSGLFCYEAGLGLGPTQEFQVETWGAAHGSTESLCRT